MDHSKKNFLLLKILQEPFIAIYPMMAIFLTKESGASAFQIALLTMLKPTVSLLSFYWGALLFKSGASLRRNLAIASCCSLLPFLFAPLITHPWYFIIAGAGYALFSRASLPGLMELLKLNTLNQERERLFAQISCYAYGIGVVVSLCCGPVLDYHPDSWKMFLAITALISLLSLFVLRLIPDRSHEEESSPTFSSGVTQRLIHPWKETIVLLKARPDFLQFQIGFFMAGFALMLVMPAIPKFLSALDISYTELFLSIGVLKGLGFMLSSRRWADRLQRISSTIMAGYVFMGFCLFIFMLLFAHFDARCVLVAYAIYGIAQAGSHLLWNLSGPLFSGTQASYQYSSINVLAIGIRGMIAPPLGGIITEAVNPTTTIILGLLVGILAAWYMLRAPARSNIATCTG